MIKEIVACEPAGNGGEKRPPGGLKDAFLRGPLFCFPEWAGVIISESAPAADRFVILTAHTNHVTSTTHPLRWGASSQGFHLHIRSQSFRGAHIGRRLMAGITDGQPAYAAARPHPPGARRLAVVPAHPAEFQRPSRSWLSPSWRLPLATARVCAGSASSGTTLLQNAPAEVAAIGHLVQARPGETFPPGRGTFSGAASGIVQGMDDQHGGLDRIHRIRLLSEISA
jgi:hypothetical protein